MVEEVRRQFREIKGIMEGKAEPDSKTCVDIATKGAIRGMMLPGAIAILTPLIIGVFFGPVTLAGTLIGIVIASAEEANVSSFVATELAAGVTVIASAELARVRVFKVTVCGAAALSTVTLGVSV